MLVSVTVPLKLVRQRTFSLRWDTGSHASREESQSVEATTASFEVGATCLLIASLSVLQDGGYAFEVGRSVVGIKR